MQQNLRNRDQTPPPGKQGRPPASIPRHTPTPVPFVEETRTDESDRRPISIGMRPMPCCGRWEVPKVQRWNPDGSAGIICPGCGRRAEFTPAMIRLTGKPTP